MSLKVASRPAGQYCLTLGLPKIRSGEPSLVTAVHADQPGVYFSHRTSNVGWSSRSTNADLAGRDGSLTISGQIGRQLQHFCALPADKVINHHNHPIRELQRIMMP